MASGVSPCIQCSQIFIQKDDDGNSIRYESGVAQKYIRLRGSLRESAERGCKLCQQLYDFDQTAGLVMWSRQQQVRLLNDDAELTFGLQLDVQRQALRITITKNIFARLEYQVYCEKGTSTVLLLAD
jgi:hypothetical protein